MNDLYLLNFNNYYNRIIKKFDDLSEYESFLCADIARKVNFNPGNGITTSVIINANNDFKIDNTPDYLLVVKDKQIESRWFVISAGRTSRGQYQLNLKRDSIADNYDETINAVSMISRAKLIDGDPAIFNSENIKFNQIKESETLLKDYTGCPWIVAYISPDVAIDQGDITGKIEGYYDESYESLTNYPFNQYLNKSIIQQNNMSFILCCLKQSRALLFMKFDLGSNPVVTEATGNFEKTIFQNLQACIATEETNSAIQKTNINWKTHFALNSVSDYARSIASSIDSDEILYFDNEIDNNTLNKIRNENGKIIKIGELYYKAVYSEASEDSFLAWMPGASNGEIVINNTLVAFSSQITSPAYPGEKITAKQLAVYGKKITLTLEQLVTPAVNFKYAFSNANLSNGESPYGIICMPYGDNINLINNGQNDGVRLDKNARIKIFQALGAINNLLYDIQLLPYCPVLGLSISQDGPTKNISIPANAGISTVKISNDGNDYITSLIVSPNANISFYLFQYPIVIENLKMQNETDLWRLCSPNYSGIFEFNATKFFNGSNNVITYFKVDCTFKPFSPYIHVAPEFKGLYGKDYDDARGLICSGDFSLDRINDAWETYQYNNKNFQLQFDRQIETMEYNRNWDTASTVINGVFGTLGNTIGMATAGGIATGGPMGAIIGGVGGFLGGAIDTGFNTAEQVLRANRNIEDTKLNFNWSNENIQAQSYGLTKVTALNKNNKLYPFIEHYTCTEKEKETFENYIKYNGMTLNRVDQIKNYIYSGEESFIKANLLRIEIANNSSIVNDINSELSRGVYFYAN